MSLQKKTCWPDSKITWKLQFFFFLSFSRGLLLEISGAGPLWHNYSRSILSNLHKRRPFIHSEPRVRVGNVAGPGFSVGPHEAMKQYVSIFLKVTWPTCAAGSWTHFLLPVGTDLSVSFISYGVSLHKMWVNAHLNESNESKQALFTY